MCYQKHTSHLTINVFHLWSTNVFWWNKSFTKMKRTLNVWYALMFSLILFCMEYFATKYYSINFFRFDVSVGGSTGFKSIHWPLMINIKSIYKQYTCLQHIDKMLPDAKWHLSDTVWGPSTLDPWCSVHTPHPVVRCTVHRPAAVRRQRSRGNQGYAWRSALGAVDRNVLTSSERLRVAVRNEP